MDVWNHPDFWTNLMVGVGVAALATSSGGDEDKETAVKNRDSLAEKMTSEQIAEAQRLASEWKPRAEATE